MGSPLKFRAAAGAVAAGLALAVATGCGSEGPLVISGTVYQSNGHPCANCAIVITSPDYPMPDLLQVTNLSGEYEWEVPGPGSFTVESATGDPVARREVTVTRDRDDVDLHLENPL